MDDNSIKVEEEASPLPIHTCPQIREKLEAMREQTQMNIRKNKVGVDVSSSIDTMKEVDVRGSVSPIPSQLSSKFHASGNSRKFQEVDFGDTVQDCGFRKNSKVHYIVKGLGESVRSSEPCVFGIQSAVNDSESDRSANNNEAGRELEMSSIRKMSMEHEQTDRNGGNEINREMAISNANGNIAKDVDLTSKEAREAVEALVNGECGGMKTVHNRGIYSSRADQKRMPGDSTGAITKQSSKGPHSSVELKNPPFSSRPSTSKCGESQEYQGDFEDISTEGTEVSSESARGNATTVTAMEDELVLSEEGQTEFPVIEDKEKPFLTATSLAIYSSIQQNGSTRSGTCVLTTTATCTFIITIVLAVAFLVAPKTLANKEPPQPRAASALSAEGSNASESNTLHRRALHANPPASSFLLMTLSNSVSPTSIKVNRTHQPSEDLQSR